MELLYIKQLKQSEDKRLYFRFCTFRFTALYSDGKMEVAKNGNSIDYRYR